MAGPQQPGTIRAVYTMNAFIESKTEVPTNVDVLKSPTQRSFERIELQNTCNVDAPPGGHPADPLQWSKWRKYRLLLAVSLAAFTGLASSLTVIAGIVIQADTYQVSTETMSFVLSAVTAGLMVGPLLLVPLAQVFGASSVIFWSLVGNLVTAIWSASMTSSSDYNSFLASRLLSGIFGSVPQCLGNAIILNIFFINERGRAFAAYATLFTLGSVAGPTLSGFVVQYQGWPVEFWWTVGLQGAVILICFFCLEETGFDRLAQRPYKPISQSWIANRAETLFPGHKVVLRLNSGQLLSYVFGPLTILTNPVTLMSVIFQSVAFGWFVIQISCLAIFLQEPNSPEEGLHGYGYDSKQTAAFLFASWIGILLAQLHGYLLNDRIPVFFARHLGEWHPEHRLHALWFPSLVVMPLGLGLFGAALQYHLDVLVLALGSCFISFGANASTAVTINYLVECLQRNPQEVGSCLNFFRLLLGLVFPFIRVRWQEEVGIAWVFGTAAFMMICSFGFMVLLMFKGQKIRQLSLCGSKRPMPFGAMDHLEATH